MSAFFLKEYFLTKYIGVAIKIAAARTILIYINIITSPTFQFSVLTLEHMRLIDSYS